MTKFALGVGEVDVYSDEKLARLKRKYPVLTFSTYCFLSHLEVSDTQIRQMYEISWHAFRFFRNNHLEVLKEVRGWD